MAELTKRTAIGGANKFEIFLISGGSFSTTPLFTFNRNIDESPSGLFERKNYVVSINAAIREGALADVLATTASEDEPEEVRDDFTNGDYTKAIVVSSSTVVLGGIFYYPEDADGMIQTDTFRFVWTGATGDIGIGNNETNKIDIEATGVQQSDAVTVPAACFDSSLISAPATKTIAADAMGTRVFETAA